MTLSWRIRKVQSIPHKSLPQESLGNFIHFPSLSVNIVNHWGINGCYGDYCPHLSGLTYLRNSRSQRRSKDRGLNVISWSVWIPLPQLLMPHSQHKQSKMARQSIEMRWAALMFWAPLWFWGAVQHGTGCHHVINSVAAVHSEKLDRNKSSEGEQLCINTASLPRCRMAGSMCRQKRVSVNCTVKELNHGRILEIRWFEVRTEQLYQ